MARWGVAQVVTRLKVGEGQAHRTSQACTTHRSTDSTHQVQRTGRGLRLRVHLMIRLRSGEDPRRKGWRCVCQARLPSPASRAMVGLQHALVVLLVASVHRAALGTPVDASLSPLDDEGDPLWLDRASHRGTIEARKDIAAAEAVTRDNLANLIRTDHKASKIDAEEADDLVRIAQLKAKEASNDRRVFDHNTAVLGVQQDKYEREYLTDNAKLRADTSVGTISQDQVERDSLMLHHIQKRLVQATLKEHTADTKANMAAEKDHSARHALRRAREKSEIDRALEEASERDHKSAVKATQDSKQDAADAAEDAKWRAAAGRPPRKIKQFEHDDRAGYIVIGKDIFRARLPGKPSRTEVESTTSPDWESEEAEDSVNDAMFSEREAGRRDVKWAHEVGAEHGFGGAENKPMAELGESLPVTTFRSGSAIEAVNQVENIAKGLSDAAKSTEALAEGSNGADSEMIQAVKALASINQAANVTIKAAAKASVSDKIEANAEDAANAPGLGQSNSMSNTQEKELEKLRKKIREQELQIAKLKQQSGPFAAEHEADRWMNEFNQKENKETVEFDQGLLKAKRKARDTKLVVQTAREFAAASNRIDDVREDMLEAEKAADKAVRDYDARVTFAINAISYARKLQKNMEKAKRSFEAYGPRMTKEQIAASVS